MKKSILFVFLVLWGVLLFAQSGELVGTFTVDSYTGSDPTPTVTGTFNSTVGFLPQNVDTNDVMLVRQVYAGQHRRKLYRITGITGNSPLTLSLTLIDGTTGGPFPSGSQSIIRRSAHGSLYDVPNSSQEVESYTMNYTINNLEGMALDTVEQRNDSLFAVLNNGTEYYVGPTSATAIDTSYQVGDSIYIVSAADTIFSGIAYANPGIDTTVRIGDSIYIITTEQDTFLCGAASQVTVSNAAPTNPATYLIHIDTLGTDTMWFNNDSVWVRFNVGGSSIGAPLFYNTTSSFTSFFPSGTPPIGALVWNPFQGTMYRKYTPTGYFSISEPNGKNVYSSQKFFQFDTLDNWSLVTHAAAIISLDAVNGHVATPGSLSTQQRGGSRTVTIVNAAGSPRTVTWSTKFRGPNGVTPLAAVSVTENSELTLDFTIDVNDTETVLRLSSAISSAGVYTFSDSANGLDLVESGGTVTVATDITELTYAAVAGADSILIWDSSANAPRRSSIAEVVALASAGTVSVTDQANGLDIALTGSAITIAPDITELLNTTVVSADSVMIWDESLNSHRRVSAGSIAALASSTGVTGVNDQPNGLDIALSGSNVQISHDFTEFTSDPTYNGTEEIMFYDLIDGTYKKATTSWLAGGYMDLLTNQVAAGTKKFSTGLQYGSGTLPTGSVFGAEGATVTFLKAGASMTDANYLNASGLAIHTTVDGGTGHQRSIFTATGNDTGNDYGRFLFRVSNGASVFTDAFEVDNLGRMNLLRSTPLGATGAAGGDINTGAAGIGFEGGISNYRMFPLNNTTQSFVITDGGFTSDYLSTGQSGWVLSSDTIIKHDIVPLTFTKAKLRSFTGYQYKLDRSDSTQIGVVAQDFLTYFPEALADQTADTLGIYPHSVAAIAYGAIGYIQEQLDEKKDSVSAEVTSTGTLVKSRITPVNSSSVASLTVNPPSSPEEGDWFAVSDSRNTSASRNIIIDFTTAGQKYLGQTATNYTLNTNGAYARFTYVNSTVGWIKTN